MILENNFFGRKFYLDTLKKRINDFKDGYRQNIAIIGDELVGKTSIIFKFLSEFYDSRVIPLYIEVRPESGESFARRFIGILLYNFLINSGKPLQEDLNFLISKSQRYIPKTVEKIESILSTLKNRRKKFNVFAELLSLPEMIYQETEKRCVVILDEFHNLETLGIKNLYPEWSKLLILQKNTMYLITSSQKFKAKNILAKNLSLLFGNFETIQVEPFDIKTSEEYLESSLLNLDLNQGLKSFLVHFTGGNPFYLQLFSKEVRRIEPAYFAELIEELLFSPSGILNQRFSNYLKRFLDTPDSQDYVTILYLIADGHNKIKDLAQVLRKQKKDLMPRINSLLELDAIERSGDFLKINDRVFSFWLKFVYQEKTRALTFDAQNQKTLFREKIEKMIQEFLENANKSLPERMTELLRLFDDDVMQLEKKRLRLTHFREIKPLEFNNKKIREGLIGRSSDNIWIIGFKKELLNEDDILEFSKECKKYQRKQQRKIIVTAKETDANTRLRALEEKVWMWNLEKLNQILDLFAKPRVIA